MTRPTRLRLGRVFELLVRCLTATTITREGEERQGAGSAGWSALVVGGDSDGDTRAGRGGEGVVGEGEGKRGEFGFDWVELGLGFRLGFFIWDVDQG